MRREKNGNPNRAILREWRDNKNRSRGEEEREVREKAEDKLTKREWYVVPF